MPKSAPLDFDAFQPARGSWFKRLLRSGLKMRMRVLIFFGLAVMVVVPINALYLQEGRHPAPLFRMSSLLPEPQIEAPLPPPRPATKAPAKIDAAKPEAAKAESVKKASGLDQIAELIDGRLPKSDAKPHHGKDAIGEALAHTDGDNKTTVLLAQRALVKLGYVLRQDGVFGGTTRQAIEKFERANRMPVTGELTPKLVKLLGQRAGLEAR